jgi:hypothetical protein
MERLLSGIRRERLLARGWPTALEEREQVGVELVLERRR